MQHNRPFYYLLFVYLGLSVLYSSLYATVHVVNVQDNNFLPSNTTVIAGDIIQWENIGSNNHNVSSQDFNYNFRCAKGCDDNGGNGNAAGFGWQTEVTFHSPVNSIPYLCEPHENIMTGSIKVVTPEQFSTISINPVNGFQPQTTTVFKGSRIQFVNQGGEHNFKADDNSFQCAAGCRDDGIAGFYLWTGQPWQVFIQFNQLGTITYHCENPEHSETGTIHVITEPPIFANGFESL